LGIVCDAATTPGRILRELLAADGLLGFFVPEALSFSDETGHCKPRPQAFQRALDGLGLPPAQVAHVGDIPRTDIAGARAAGLKAVRFAGVDDRTEDPQADAVVRDHRELLPLLAGW
ncbi:MAG TPA: HAD family hydrolase, partial [Deinococcales bacterium]|nr:HAD family hydrolase [Deinococcales bacterium]